MIMVLRNGARHQSDGQRLGAAETGENAARLVELNLRYAYAIASEVSRKLPLSVERNDIQGWAELGLVEAAESFDPRRGIQFKTFSYYRIKGAIYDGLRKMGWYPKGQYQRMRFEVAANEYLKDASAESPAPASPEAQWRDVKDVTANLLSCYMLSLEAIPQDPIDKQQVSAEESVARREQLSHLRRCLSLLPERNRAVLELFYFEDLSLEAIGRKLGLSKSWVCRLHAKSLELLRKLLSQRRPVLPETSPATFSRLIR
jgi:RNA polymerase sigma factor for flagellar operon FliA